VTWAVGSSGEAARVSVPEVALSTISVYPANTATGFATAARLGYDGVEVMVTNDPVSQSIDSLRRLSDGFGVPILAVHAPCLFWLNLQRVWGTEPWAKLVKAREAADALGAKTVVVHPPFSWQRDYAKRKPFADRLAKLEREIAALDAERREIEDWLASPDAYADTRKDELKERLARQADLRWQLARLETEWLEISQILEKPELET